MHEGSLASRSNVHAARTAIRSVSKDAIVCKRVNSASSAHEHAVAGVTVDLVLRDLSTRTTEVAGITCAETILAVGGDLACPNRHEGKLGPSRIHENAICGVIRKYRSAGADLRTRPCVQAIGVAGKPDIIQRYVDKTCGTGCVDTVKRVVPDDGVPHVQIQSVGVIRRNTVARVEPEDYAVFNIHGLGLKDVYAAYAITEPVNGNSP